MLTRTVWANLNQPGKSEGASGEPDWSHSAYALTIPSRDRRRATAPAAGGASPTPPPTGTDTRAGHDGASLRASRSCAARWALRSKVVRNSSSEPSAPNCESNELTAATPSLISVDTKCSSSTTVTRPAPGSAATASRASATISQAKLGAQKYVGSRSSTRISADGEADWETDWGTGALSGPDDGTEPGSETVTDDTKPRSVIGRARSGSRTGESAPQT